MAQVSKNSRIGSGSQKFFCSCGGEVKMRSLFQSGKMSHLAECEKCKRQERRPSDFN
ncbi:hypothetical protein PVA44_04165 [Entomospira nematocerorum]|uniref:Uncharacterized protein n=2 Tax=Entomospira TaxID=2834378 RepID=A0A968GCA0_9SPIO|nr:MULTISPECIES: hypothetical protein [Entomospira]NIZ40738.1 hypothetical protein [Entomospira entomophilus]NIZ46778.1 hypothetical protein [Entomospira nematocera]WDI33425.1 hypothetical protein PVA44_04165 [Entomospira nematocera]WDI34951.1 hypothetical protein PVA45_04345 [Entomospira entomophilus]